MVKLCTAGNYAVNKRVHPIYTVADWDNTLLRSFWCFFFFFEIFKIKIKGGSEAVRHLYLGKGSVNFWKLFPAGGPGL